MSETKLPEGWQVAKLGDICRVTSGGTPSREEPKYWNGSIPWVKTGEINYNVITTTEECISDEGLENSSAKVIPAGTLLMAMYGQGVTRGRVAILGIDATINQACSAIFTSEAVLTEFLFYFLAYNYENIRSLGHGANQKNLNSPLIKSIQVLLPPPSEQQAIAETLRAVQQARESRRRELALERESKAALMQHLFTHGTQGEPRRQTEIGEIPQSWQVVKLGEVCSIRYGLGQPPELDDAGIPMIRATDVKVGRIISHGVLRVKQTAIPMGKKPFLEWGDIIVVRSGAYTGDVAMYDGRWETAIAGYDLVVSPLSNDTYPPFIAERLLENDIQNYFKGQRHRSAQPHINSKQLGDTTFALPPPPEQRDIATVLQACDTKIAALERESALLEELFRALLEELMTGRIRVKDEDGRMKAEG